MALCARGNPGASDAHDMGRCRRGGAKPEPGAAWRRGTRRSLRSSRTPGSGREPPGASSTRPPARPPGWGPPSPMIRAPVSSSCSVACTCPSWPETPGTGESLSEPGRTSERRRRQDHGLGRCRAWQRPGHRPADPLRRLFGLRFDSVRGLAGQGLFRMSSGDLFWVRPSGAKVTFRSACRLAGQCGLRHSMSVTGGTSGAIASDDRS